ncbi:MAG TPA: flagella basal body P-ring formation protein FlgA [Stenotrophomonas sp.]|nr:flagella basal body P-ring formation protein FlgA [Stenotrophomonas sp.]
MRWIILALLALAASTASAASGWQPVDSIRAAALSTLPAGSEGDTTLDSALRLPACGQGLRAQPTGTSTVEVSCPDAGGWRLFVPVRVRRNQTVLILNRGISAGETLGAADITTAQRDVARIAGAALADPAVAVGRVARRTLSAGSLLSANDLVAQRLVRRGDNVSLVSRLGGVEVRVAGKAMADAGENERVSVENLSSRKIVQGTVAASGDVFVTR